LGIVEKSGAFYRYSGMVLGQGKAAALSFLQDPENKHIVQELEKKIRDAATSGKTLPKELGENDDEE